MRAQKVKIAKHPTAAGILARGTFRFLSGRPLYDGEDRTDATWTHKGTKSYGDRRAHWWDYQTKTLRVGTRLGSVSAVVATGYGLVTDSATTLTGLHVGAVSVGSAAAAALGYTATDAALLWSHNHDYVWPLHLVLMEALALPVGTRPRHYLKVPRNYNEITGDALSVEVPAGMVLSAETRRAVETACREKLALQDASFSWHTTGAEHYVAVQQLPRPPERADFEMEYVRLAVEKADPAAPVIGISHSGNVIAKSIDSDSPHVLFVMGSGAGKSVMLRSISAQLMHHGAEIVVLDYKQGSQPYMRRIKGIRYAREISAIHNALIYVGEQAEERRRLTAQWIDEGGDPEDKKHPNPYINHRLCLFFEEANSTLKALKKYWKRIKDKEDPEQSPAVAAFEELLNMGRSEMVHAFVVAQDGRESEIGPRINYGVRVFARYDKKTWNLLAEAGTAPKTSGTRGRVQVVANGAATETQGIFFTNNEALEWATTGRGRTASTLDASTPEAEIAQPLPGEVDAPGLDAPEPASRTHTHALGAHPLPGEDGSEPHAAERERETEPGGSPAPADLPPNVVPFARREHGQDDDATAEPETEIVKLVNMRQASQDQGEAVIPMNYDAIRRAKLDDPEFPDPDGKIKGYPAWKPETLQAWHRNRVRTANK